MRKLFNEEGDFIVPVVEFKNEDLQEAFDGIMLIRKKLFDKDPLFEIADMMKDLGLMPCGMSTASPKKCNASYMYTQLDKAERKMRILKEYDVI